MRTRGHARAACMSIRMHTSFWTPARAPGTSPHHWRVCMLTRFVRARHAIAAMRTHARRRVARTRVRVAFPRTARCARAQVQAVIQSGANRFVPLFAVSTALRRHTWRSSCRLATFRSKLVLLDTDMGTARRRCGRSAGADVGKQTPAVSKPSRLAHPRLCREARKQKQSGIWSPSREEDSQQRASARGTL